MTKLAISLMLAFSSVASLCGAEGYPAPENAGFHHCALIYNRERRSADDLAPYVARYKQGHAREWLFDSFLFLVQDSGRGIRTEYGATNRTDWQYQFDRWFAPARDLNALDEAIDNAARELKTPPFRQIILSVPYPNPEMRDFGDVNSNGKSEDLSTPEGRRAALVWFVAEAQRLFHAAHYRHLQLWGFYWMREDMAPGDDLRIRDAADIVHSAGLKLLWIPYFKATGWDRWRSAGIDVAIMQPNYAFWSSNHRGNIRSNRLALSSSLSKTNGMGVEMEMGDPYASSADERAFRQYLAFGGSDRLGYRNGAQAYYLGLDMVERTSSSTKPAMRAIYDALADYVLGRYMPYPDQALSWKWRDNVVNGHRRRVGEASLNHPIWINDLEVYLDEPKASWYGKIAVEVKREGSNVWSPGGWAIRPSRDDTAGRYQVVVVPIAARISALRAAFDSRNEEAPKISSIALNSTEEGEVARHLALGCPYLFSPAPSASYGDDGRKLIDGVVPANGYLSGRMVGWYESDVSVRFDLGKVMPVTKIEVCCQGGGVASINWPAKCVALLSDDMPPPPNFSAVGAHPANLLWLSPKPSTVDNTRSPNDMDGRLLFELPKPAKIRYVTLLFGSNGWLMLSEIRIYSHAQNVAPFGGYTLAPSPTPKQQEEPTYPDDGAKLTDGRIAKGFAASELVGWRESEPRNITVDLGSVRSVNSVTAWSLRGGLYDIYAPVDAVAEASLDGREWKEFGKATAAGSEDGKTCEPAAYIIRPMVKMQARWIRIKVTRSRGWAMLSEIEVK